MKANYEDNGHTGSSYARTSQVLMGAIFLLAGLPKTWDPARFYWDVVPYAFLLQLEESASHYVSRAALSLGPIECVIGLAMVVNWRRQYVYPVATALMAGFTALVGFAWYRGYDESCGCFGSLIERGPQGAFLEDLLMLGLLVYGWIAGRDSVEASPRAGTIVTLTTAGVLLLGAVQMSAGMDRITDSDLRVGVALSDIEVEGVEGASWVGSQVVVVMTPTCARCRRAVPRLNELATDRRLGDVIAVTYYEQDSKEMLSLREELEPTFPIGTVSRKDFMRVAWGHGVPRVAVTRDGIVERVWEAYEIPTVEEIEDRRKKIEN